MIYLLVDLKIVLALHPSDQNQGQSEGGAYPREGRLSEGGALIQGRGANSNKGGYQNLKSCGGGAVNRAGVEGAR